MAKGKARFDHLDLYLLQKDYEAALAAVSDEIARRPDNVNLQLRQAEILGLLGERDRAIALYRTLARRFAEDGFYARAIAVANKVKRLDPGEHELNRELAEFIASRQEAEREDRERLRLHTAPATAAAAPVAREATPAVDAAASGSTGRAVPAGGAGQPADTPAARASAQEQREREASRFFAEFPAGALEELLASTSVHSFAPDEVIVREGAPGDSMFLIEDGTVRVQTNDSAGRPLELARLGAGEFFGEVAVHTGRPRTATIVAQTPVTVIEISRDDLGRIAVNHPTVTEVVRRFCEQRAAATVEVMLQRLRSRDD